MAKESFRGTASYQTGIPLVNGRTFHRTAQSNPPNKQKRQALLLICAIWRKNILVNNRFSRKNYGYPHQCSEVEQKKVLSVPFRTLMWIIYLKSLENNGLYRDFTKLIHRQNVGAHTGTYLPRYLIFLIMI